MSILTRFLGVFIPTESHLNCVHMLDVCAEFVAVTECGALEFLRSSSPLNPTDCGSEDKWATEAVQTPAWGHQL